MKLSHLLTTALIALCLCGCASSSMKETWKSPQAPNKPVQKVAVLAVDDRGIVRGALESRFVRDLVRHDQEALATIGLLGMDEIKADKQAAAARLVTEGADSVLIVRLVDQATFARQVAISPALYSPDVPGYDTYAWYDYFLGAYGAMTVVHSSMDRKFYFDTSLFDLKNGHRLWSGLTLTKLKENSDALVAADDLSKLTVDALRKDGLVR